MGQVISINISSTKGTEKNQVMKVNVIKNWGLENDSHAGHWDRQVSIFPIEALEKVPPEKLKEVLNGGYTENFTIKDFPLKDLVVGAVIRIGEAEIEIFHIGKEKYKENGRPYIVSREGRFGKVIKGGEVKIGDSLFLVK